METENNISEKSSSKLNERDKLYFQLLSILKELICCYQELIVLEKTPKWIKLMTIGNLCELGYHFFQCACLLSLFDESLLESLFFKFLDLLLPAFPPYGLLEQNKDYLSELQKYKKKNLQKKQNLSESKCEYVDSVSENETDSLPDIGLSQQFNFLLDQIGNKMIPVDALSIDSSTDAAGPSVSPKQQVNGMNPEGEEEEEELHVYEGESERLSESPKQTPPGIVCDSMAPSSTLSAIHSQLFGRAPKSPAEEVFVSSTGEANEIEKNGANENQNSGAENSFPASENPNSTQETANQNQSSVRLPNEAQRNDLSPETPNEVTDVRNDGNFNFVVYESNGEASLNLANQILNRIREQKYVQRAAVNGIFLLNGGVYRYRRQPKAAEISSETQGKVSQAVQRQNLQSDIEELPGEIDGTNQSNKSVKTNGAEETNGLDESNTQNKQNEQKQTKQTKQQNKSILTNGAKITNRIDEPNQQNQQNHQSQPIKTNGVQEAKGSNAITQPNRFDATSEAIEFSEPKASIGTNGSIQASESSEPSASSEPIEPSNPSEPIEPSESVTPSGAQNPAAPQVDPSRSDAVFGGRNGFARPSQRVGFAASLSRLRFTESFSTSSGEPSDGMTAEELLRHLNYFPLPQNSFNSDIPVYEYSAPNCSVFNKHARNMIQPYKM